VDVAEFVDGHPYYPGDDQFPIDEVATLTFTASGTDVHSGTSTDAGTGVLTFTGSGADTAQRVDAATASFTYTASALEERQRYDAATATLLYTPSGTDEKSGSLTDAATGLLTFTGSATDIAQYSDAVQITSFGSLASGASARQLVADFKHVLIFTANATGDVRKGRINAQILSGAAPNIRMVIYAVSGGAPGALLGTSDQLTPAALTEGILEFTFSTPVAVTNGTDYAIGTIQDRDYIIRQASGTQNYFVNADTYSDGASNPFGSASPTSGTITAFQVEIRSLPALLPQLTFTPSGSDTAQYVENPPATTTLGTLTSSASETEFPADFKFVQVWTANASGTVYGGRLNVATLAGSQVNIRMVIYAMSGGVPTTLLGMSDVLSLAPGVTGVRDVTFSTPVALTSGVDYAIGTIGDFHYDLRCEAGSKASFGNADTYSDGPSNPFGSASSSNNTLWNVQVTITGAATNAGQLIFTPSGTEQLTGAGTDAGTGILTFTASGVDTAQRVDAATAALTYTASGTDTAQRVDSATATMTYTPSGTDEHTVGGTQYTDTATGSITFTPSGVDQAVRLDAATGLVTFTPSGVEYSTHTYSDVATGILLFTPSIGYILFDNPLINGVLLRKWDALLLDNLYAGDLVSTRWTGQIPLRKYSGAQIDKWIEVLLQRKWLADWLGRGDE
jgi:hypothetical protein